MARNCGVFKGLRQDWDWDWDRILSFAHISLMIGSELSEWNEGIDFRD